MSHSIWAVDVSVNGESILTISPNELSGKAELTEEDKDVIRLAAYNLISFLGESFDYVP